MAIHATWPPLAPSWQAPAFDVCVVIAILVTAFAGVSGVLGRRVRSRGIPLSSQPLVVAVAVATVMAGGYGSTGAPVAWIVMVFATTWTVVISVVTDMACLKIPREPCWVGGGVSAVCLGVLAVSGQVQWLLVGVTVGLLLIAYAVILHKVAGMGFGDVRLALAVSSSVAAVVGTDPTVIPWVLVALVSGLACSGFFRRRDSKGRRRWPMAFVFGVPAVTGMSVLWVMGGAGAAWASGGGV